LGVIDHAPISSYSKAERCPAMQKDTRSVEQIREILRMQFDGAAAHAADPTRLSILQELSATTADIPATMIEAYWEIFEDLRDAELAREMLRGIGISWWPET
jgi:hypothetical protein